MIGEVQHMPPDVRDHLDLFVWIYVSFSVSFHGFSLISLCAPVIHFSDWSVYLNLVFLLFIVQSCLYVMVVLFAFSYPEK